MGEKMLMDVILGYDPDADREELENFINDSDVVDAVLKDNATNEELIEMWKKRATKTADVDTTDIDYLLAELKEKFEDYSNVPGEEINSYMEQELIKSTILPEDIIEVKSISELVLPAPRDVKMYFFDKDPYFAVINQDISFTEKLPQIDDYIVFSNDGSMEFKKINNESLEKAAAFREFAEKNQVTPFLLSLGNEEIAFDFIKDFINLAKGQAGFQINVYDSNGVFVFEKTFFPFSDSADNKQTTRLIIAPGFAKAELLMDDILVEEYKEEIDFYPYFEDLYNERMGELN